MKHLISLLKKVLARSNSLNFGWFCIFFFLFFPFYSYGDGVGLGFDGHTLYPINNDSIKLVSELLKMQQNDGDVKTHCWYLLKNITNDPQNLTIGFYIGDSSGYYPFFNDSSDFVVYVDGKKTDYQKKIIGDATSGSIQPIYYAIYYGVWDMSFLPNESKMVYVEQILRWNEFGPRENFKYELNLAKRWEGKPERIEVYYDFGDRSFSNSYAYWFGNYFSMKDTMWGISRSIDIKPKNYKLVNDREIKWVFENTDSIDDIIIDIVYFGKTPKLENILSNFSEEYNPSAYRADKELFSEKDMKCWYNHMSIEELNDTSLKKLKEIKNRYEAYKIILKYYPAFLRNCIYAKHGYKFKSKLWKNVFSKCEWYEPRDDFSESEFNSFERENIKFILDYEKNIDEYLKTLE